MNDKDIVDLYMLRDENAIKETAAGYGGYIHSIVSRILRDPSDSEECENDVYNTLWNSIPPKQPVSFKAFLGKVARNAALDRYSYNNAEKRSSRMNIVLSELGECVPAGESVERATELKELAGYINEYLGGLDRSKRQVFVRRYWYCDGIRDIAGRFGYSESKVKSMLMRARAGLKKYLERQGIKL